MTTDIIVDFNSNYLRFKDIFLKNDSFFSKKPDLISVFDDLEKLAAYNQNNIYDKSLIQLMKKYVIGKKEVINHIKNKNINFFLGVNIADLEKIDVLGTTKKIKKWQNIDPKIIPSETSNTVFDYFNYFIDLAYKF